MFEIKFKIFELNFRYLNSIQTPEKNDLIPRLHAISAKSYWEKVQHT